MKVAIFLCYGLYESTNQEYTDYINSMVSDVIANGVEKLIICGGHTNPHKNISEAETVGNFLKTNNKIKIPILLESESLITSQNLEFASKNVHTDDTITVFCDLYRLAKVIWLAAHFLLKKTKSEISDALLEYAFAKKIKPFAAWNLTIMPFDFPSRDKYIAFGQSFSSILEIEAIYDKELDEKIIKQRKSDFGIEN